MKNNLVGKRAALYTRVSTEDQATHGVSLEAQRERLIEYAHAHDMKIVGIYTDEGISARKKYTRRPALCSIIEDIKAGKVDIILFVKLDRWFRNIADFYEIQTILDKYKIDWIATEEDYDTTTANGRLSLNVRLAIAQDEADRTSERIKFTFNNLAKQGRVVTGVLPFGYRVGPDKKPEIVEEDAEIVRDLFNKYITCRSARETLQYALKTFGRNMESKGMRRMLSCTWYIGEAHDNKNYCPRIIDDDTFKLAQKFLNERASRHIHERSNRVYYFQGLIKCAECGHAFVTYACPHRDPAKPSYIYYRCGLKAQNNSCDNRKHINQEKLEEWMLDNLETELDKYNFNVKKSAEKKRKPVNTAKITAKIEKLKDLYLNDLLPRDIYERDYASLSAQLEEAQVPIPQPIDTSFLANFRDAYPTLDPEARKAIWGKIVDKISISSDGGISVTFNQL
jgi:DNA invertase Pin-like site-specific DNA recombinase